MEYFEVPVYIYLLLAVALIPAVFYLYSIIKRVGSINTKLKTTALALGFTFEAIDADGVANIWTLKGNFREHKATIVCETVEAQTEQINKTIFSMFLHSPHKVNGKITFSGNEDVQGKINKLFNDIAVRKSLFEFYNSNPSVTLDESEIAFSVDQAITDITVYRNNLNRLADVAELIETEYPKTGVGAI
jgi:hypothetical protein